MCPEAGNKPELAICLLSDSAPCAVMPTALKDPMEQLPTQR